jgi:translocation and assembly module TamB
MRRPAKHLLIGTGILCGLVLLVLAGLRIYLDTDHGRRLIQAKINDTIPGTLTFESLAFSLLGSDVTLRGLVIMDPSGKECAGFERLFVDFSWLPLLRGEIRVKTLVLEKPWVVIQVDREGRANLVRAFSVSSSETEGAGPEKGGAVVPNVVVEQLKIVQGSVDYVPAGPGFKVLGRSIDLAAHLDLLKRSGGLAIEIGKIDLESPEVTTEFQKLKLAATLQDGRIEPLVLEVKTPASSLTVSGHIDDLFIHPILNVTLDLTAGLSKIRKALNIEPTLEGRAGVHLVARGALEDPDLSLHFELEKGNLSGMQIERAVLDGRLQNRLLVLNKVQVNTASGVVSANGEADLRKAFPGGFLAPERDVAAVSYRLFLEGDGLDLAALIPTAHHLTGTAKASVSVEGRGFSLETLSAKSKLEVLGRQIRADGVAEPIDVHLSMESDLDHGTANVSALEAQAGEIKLQSSGHVRLSSGEMEGRLLLDAPQLSRVLAIMGMGEGAGSMNVQAEVSGSLTRPVFDGNLQGEGLRFRDMTMGDVQLKADLDGRAETLTGSLSLNAQGVAFEGRPLGSLDIRAGLSDGIIHLEEGKIQNQRSRVRISGTGRLFAPGTLESLANPTFDLMVESDGIYLDDFSGGLKGKLTLSAKLEGSKDEPRGTLDVYGSDLDLDVQKLHEIRLHSELDGEKVRLDPLQLTVAPGEILEAKGWATFQKAFDVALTSKGISLHNVDKVREAGNADGKLVMNISAAGTLEDPKIAGEIALREVRVMEKPLQDFLIHLDVRDQTATVSGKLNFEINGSYHLQRKDFSATVLFHDTDLSPYFNMADRADLSGRLTGKIEASGNAAAMEQAEGTVHLSALDLFLEERELLHADRIEASYRQEVLSISDFRARLLKEGHLELTGHGKQGGPLAFQANADIPLAVVGLLVDESLEPEGSLLVTGQVGGTPAQPEIRGDLVLKDAGLTVPTLFQKVHDVNGGVEVTRGKITIHDIEGQFDSGRFELGGAIDLDGLEPKAIDLHFKGDAVPLQVPDTMDLVLSAELRAHGSRENSVIEGEIILIEGTYYRDVNLSLLDAVRQKKREVSAPPTEIEQPFLKNLHYDVSVKRRNPFMVQNNLADLEINPDLHIAGKSNNPVIQGRAEVLSGTITYRKKTFDVKKGVVDFLNPYKTEPSLDIEGEAEVRRWKIFLALSGTPDALTLKLRSDPSEEDADILSLLLVGKTTRELIGGEGGTSTSTSQILTQALASTFAEDVKAAAGVDILEAETGGEGTPERVKVTVGEELSKRMVIKYAVESTNGEVVHRAIAEYKLLENVLLGGFQDTRGVFGGQLQFRLDFR